MFGGGIWSSNVGSDNHLTKERDPPARPINLEFPEYSPPFQPRSLSSKTSSRLQKKICHTKSFTQIQDADLTSLNIQYKRDVPLADLVPRGHFEDRPFLYDDDLQAMLNEIGLDNRDAYREVLRMPPLPGRSKPRLAYARNFFGNLEDMARYFDTSFDEYYCKNSDSLKKVSNVPEESREAAASSTTDVEMKDAVSDASNVSQGGKPVYKGYRIANAESMNPGTRIAMTKNLLKIVMHKFQCRDHEPMPQPREKFTFRGIRLQSIQYHFCVARIPQDVKQARARLVEGPIMAVHVRDELRFKSKEGLLTPEKTGFVGEKFDLLREIGCMLILAVQRARNQTASSASSADSEKWWVTKQRWGGGPTSWGQLACEVYEDDDPSVSPEERKLRDEIRKKETEQQETRRDAEQMMASEVTGLNVDSMLAKAPSEIMSSPRLDSQPHRKKARGAQSSTTREAAMKDGRRLMYVAPARRKWYQDWQVLRPNATTADDKIISRQIGRGDDLEVGFDEVYLLTSCNHHVCISKMKVHADYLEWLESGKGVEDSEKKSHILSVQRTVWYDMFNAEARKEFLTGLWRLMCWVNRNEIPQVEFEKMEDKKKATMTTTTTPPQNGAEAPPNPP